MASDLSRPFFFFHLAKADPTVTTTGASRIAPGVKTTCVGCPHASILPFLELRRRIDLGSAACSESFRSPENLRLDDAHA